MNTFMICSGMVCKLVVSCVVFSRWCVVQLSNVLFLCLDLNGFKEAICQQESVEENGCSLIVFGVTFLCLCHFPLKEFVGLGLLWSYSLGSSQIPKKRVDTQVHIDIDDRGSSINQQCCEKFRGLTYSRSTLWQLHATAAVIIIHATTSPERVRT